jgi:ribosome-binding ATPase YchF (GTP1/OBG family)
MQSTLFNAIVENGKAAAANFPFCTIEPNVGMVTVPDARLQQLSDVSGSRETVSRGEERRSHVVVGRSGFVPKTNTRACS